MNDARINEIQPKHHDSDDRIINSPRDCEDLAPVEQSAFKKKLDRKFRPIPAIVAKAAQARAELNL